MVARLPVNTILNDGQISCIPPLNTVPHGGQITVYSTSQHRTSQHSTTCWSDHCTFHQSTQYQSAQYHMAVRSLYIPPVNTVPLASDLILRSSEHAVSSWNFSMSYMQVCIITIIIIIIIIIIILSSFSSWSLSPFPFARAFRCHG